LKKSCAIYFHSEFGFASWGNWQSLSDHKQVQQQVFAIDNYGYFQARQAVDASAIVFVKKR